MMDFNRNILVLCSGHVCKANVVVQRYRYLIFFFFSWRNAGFGRFHWGCITVNTLVAMFIVTAHLRSFSFGISTDPSIKFIECSQIMCIILLCVL